jgi:hypothetical protein
MSATAQPMPLCTSQEAPCFWGAANSLNRYLATMEALCQDCQQNTGPELIKWTVYYADERSEDSFAAARDALTDPANWNEFKHTVRGSPGPYDPASLIAAAPRALCFPAKCPDVCHCCYVYCQCCHESQTETTQHKTHRVSER